VKALSISSFLSWRGGLFRSLQTTGPDAEPDGLNAFAAEQDADSSTALAASPAARGRRWMMAALAVVALVEAPVVGLWLYERTQPAPAAAIAAVAPKADIPLGAPLPVTAIPARVDPVVPEHSAVAASASSPRATTADPERAASSLTVGGWVSMKTPVPMQVFEEGRLVGTTDIERIMLPVGTHRLEIVSEALGYRSRQEVAIRAGQTSTLRLDMPTGALAVNAQPWAEVWVDGDRVGETPIGNLTRTIGPHEIVFRHPELGEKKTTVVVTLKEPARVGVDLRSKS
jgi:hypothetical protein